MHTNQLLYYADFGMLADVTDLYDDVDPNYYKNHFSEISCSNASGSDGRLYGVPKDKDNGMLVYNKEMFDAAGVAYPTDDWTWEDMTEASQKIMTPPASTALWPTTTCGASGISPSCPNAPTPSRTARAWTKRAGPPMSNGLCYATGAHGKKLEAALDVIKYFGTEETWRSAFSSYEEQLNLDVCFDQFDYAIQAVYNSASPKWKSQVLDELNKAYNGDQDLTTSLENMQSIVNTETAKKLAKIQREGT